MKELRGKVVAAALLSLDETDQSKPLAQLIDEQLMDEDMLAVEYPNRFFLHVGWYSDAPRTANQVADGNFEVVLTRNHDHEKPIFVWRCKNFKELWPVIEFADDWVARAD